MIIIMRFCKNNVLCPKYINILYVNLGGGVREDAHIPLYIFCLLFQKIEKVQEHDLYLNQILHNFDYKEYFIG